jgi:2-polyprenyl-3-methyl-5-hydroxy-6-metoxy-1,4-benzoquinol methylase
MSHAIGQNANAGQLDYWNGKIGHDWVQYQAQLDGQLEPLGLEGIRVLNPTSGERILDIGCGCGQTTQALADHVGSKGAVTGVDISAPMLEVAKVAPVGKGACRPDYLELDA